MPEETKQKSHRDTIARLAVAVSDLSVLLDVPKDAFMMVIPKVCWMEFCNRVSLDANGIVETSPPVAKEVTPRWLKILGVYYVPAMK